MLKPSATNLRVGGLTRLSTCDWPGELAAVVFCQGCVWDCAYCHNPGLRPAQAAEPIAWSTVVRFLASRRGLLDAVVFSGGEPTQQPALLPAIEEVRALGFRIGLHTTGMATERFAQLLPLLDWVGFDVKAPFASYARITGVEHSGDAALVSLKSLLLSNVSYEVRTTLHPALLGTEDILAIEEQLLALGVARFAIQRFRPHGTRGGRLRAAAGFSLPPAYGSRFPHFEVR